MYLTARSLFVTFSVLVLAACGGGSAGGPECTTGQMSLPGQMNDPCKQAGTPCADMKGTGVATCGPDSRWSTCECKLPLPATTGTSANPALVAPPAACGDNIVQKDKGEDCERGQVAATCASLLGPGATGLIMCNTQCKYDMSMCIGSGGATGGMGAGGMGAGGSGAMRGTAGMGR